MEQIALILSKAGHDITYFVHTEYTASEILKAANVTIITYEYPTKDLTYILGEDTITDFTKMTILEEMAFVFQKGQIHDIYVNYSISAYFSNMDQWRGLKAQNFDLIIFDSHDFALGRLMKEYLDRPAILWSNAGFEMHIDNWLVPLPVSYIPIMFVSYSDQMTFKERAMNTFYYVALQYYMKDWCDTRNNALEKVADKVRLPHKIRPVLNDADLIFIQSNFPYFYPRPIMPNVVPVLGLLDRDHKPIDAKFLNFIDGANDGFIIFTLGTLATGFDAQTREIFATAFAMLKQRVLWRYIGSDPLSLGNNTMLSPWLPQNDLLGHPKLKLFITHCGSGSSGEAVYNAAPVIGLPLFLDQRHHCALLTKRHKMGLTLSFADITLDTFSAAIVEVLGNPQYKKNAVKAQKLVRDQPINATYTIQYWCEYIMKHKGAHHLKSSAMFELNFFQYFLLDILLLVLVTVVISLAVLYCIIKQLVLCLCKYKSQKLKKS
ncbi:unnamed protein product [Owenia fusiformis]|uniref:UDP-glucuronosyltransferase n=1 Tax=Owenia fusiformis TaxID=6347 RepID=A0A8J1TXF0_OWEFU|nr:unnamed protein product [Owenia fusiformis]